MMKTVNRSNCPILRATDEMGDQWSILILREFFLEGPQKFADLQEQLGLSPNTLSARLKNLEQSGILNRQMYSTHPPRAEYVLTDKGQALESVLDAVFAWGKSYTPERALG
ncbi:winged helix-turn-helix transcriptional regulator [Aliiroseovarius sp. 2305UL8-7]|uniref:winged helix-turn-helix transcriptional regulator n=1 Tax=Aliiroseovarius conchicola TaxID=3121637 RepID=UPI0035279514